MNFEFGGQVQLLLAKINALASELYVTQDLGYSLCGILFDSDPMSKALRRIFREFNRRKCLAQAGVVFDI